MSPRIAYWTSSFEPHMEAIASEVALLREAFPSSVAWGMSHRRWALLSRRRGYCLHPRLHLLFRLATRLLERAFDLHHVFDSLGDWFYLTAPRRQPTVLTVAFHSPPVERDLLERIDRFVVEHPGGRDELERLGIDRRRVRLIFPPVNLERFSPCPPPAQPFTVLFASSPEKESWLEARGVPQLVEAAALRPGMRFRFLWRPWGNSADRVRRWIAEKGLRNVELVVGCWKDMAPQYRAAHVCAAPFTDPARSKPAPNSVVESLACGRPVVVTEQVGLAELVRQERAGLVSAATGEALAEQLDRLQAGWDQYAQAARRLAERWFGTERFVAAYQRLYEEVMAARPTSAGGAGRRARGGHSGFCPDPAAVCKNGSSSGRSTRGPAFA
jgi:glycosyltransferase involved in cell wall biosynthesis